MTSREGISSDASQARVGEVTGVQKAVGGGAPRVRLAEFDWAPLVQRGFFQGMVTAYVGAGLSLILFESQAMVPPPLLLINVPLSLLCALLAFTRVWKTIREEHETSEQWDDIEQSGHDLALDRVFEIPYLFTLTVLPFVSIAPQIFMATLAVFYVSDNFYNAGLARGAAARMSRGGTSRRRNDAGAPESYLAALATAVRRSVWLTRGDTAPVTGDAMVEYFRTRSLYNTTFMAVLAAGFVLVTVLMASGSTATAGIVTLVAISTVLVGEWLAEPRRNRDELWSPSDDADLESSAETPEDPAPESLGA